MATSKGCSPGGFMPPLGSPGDLEAVYPAIVAGLVGLVRPVAENPSTNFHSPLSFKPLSTAILRKNKRSGF
jgi:hypothetical protein